MNEGQPIRYLISAPTMRIPTNVSKTVNAYLAFRAILREGETILVYKPLSMPIYINRVTLLAAVRAHNAAHPDDPIKTVLCPGLGTAVGRMPHLKCAVQMRTAFDAVILKSVEAINKPAHLGKCCSANFELLTVNI